MPTSPVEASSSLGSRSPPLDPRSPDQGSRSTEDARSEKDILDIKSKHETGRVLNEILDIGDARKRSPTKQKRCEIILYFFMKLKTTVYLGHLKQWILAYRGTSHLVQPSYF